MRFTYLLTYQDPSSLPAVSDVSTRLLNISVLLIIIHRIHRSHQLQDTDGMSKHRLLPYNAYYL